MSRDFVIVIEADNKRAFAAYQKGLEDLNRIWPQVVHFADLVDEKQAKWKEAQKQRRLKEFSEYKAKKEQHQKELKEWEEYRGLFRPARPVFTELEPFGYRQSYLDAPFEYRTPKAIERYESIRKELRHLANVAGAAIGPYRMTEYQVDEMVAWENGSAVERIKRDISTAEKVGEA